MTYNILNNFRGAVEIDDTFVDPHLESIPSLGTFTTRCFSGSDSQDLQFKQQFSLLQTSLQVLISVLHH